MTPHPTLEAIELSVEHSKELIAEILHKPIAVEFIESSLQALAQKNDGTKLLSAFGSPNEFLQKLSPLDFPIEYVTETLKDWADSDAGKDGSLEVMFDFGDTRQRSSD
jgi:hypothetical protein